MFDILEFYFIVVVIVEFASNFYEAANDESNKEILEKEKYSNLFKWERTTSPSANVDIDENLLEPEHGMPQDIVDKRPKHIYISVTGRPCG